MIILTDICGILLIIILGIQGYKDGDNLSHSYTIPALFSFSIFYKVFPHAYSFFLNIIPNTMGAGIVTTIIINCSLIIIFRIIVIKLVAIYQQHFFMPEITSVIKNSIGIAIGIFAGYVFVTGAITSLESQTHNATLQRSVLYKIINHPEPYNETDDEKIDNIPSLQPLYSENNVIRFNFTEQELIAVLRMIRTISNQDANILVQQLNGNTKINEVYKTLITLYSQIDKNIIESKYIVSPEMIKILQIKIGYDKKSEQKQAQYTNNNVKSISDIIDLI